jgi:hypothetical protein
MRSVIAATALAMLVAGCGDGGQQAQSNNKIAVRGPEQEQLHKLNDFNRAIALKRAVYDSGYTCGRVTRSVFVGSYENLDEWMVSCADGRDWAVFIGPDGSAQVRDCKDVKGLGLPECALAEKGGSAEPAKTAGNDG